MKYSTFLLSFVFPLLLLTACARQQQESGQTPDVQGHRGARGLMPENTIPAFLKALEYPHVTTLELDLAVTVDQQLVVSHEPWLNPEICITPAGDELPDTTRILIYELAYAEIQKYDCGTKYYERFPQQEKIAVSKPLLEDVVKQVTEKLSPEPGRKISYNMEIKSRPEYDDKYTPDYRTFSDLVYDFINRHLAKEQVTIQSFDFRVLQYFHEKYPEIKLVALVENENGIINNLNRLGFKPDVYSPWYKQLNKDSVALLHSQDIRVIPWTVNEMADMQALLNWEVDGIITDYPNFAEKLLTENE